MSTIKVEHKEKTVSVRVAKRSVGVLHRAKTFNIHEGGRRGLKGDPGTGVPAGGQAGEVLVKTEDGTAWGAFEGADKNFVMEFEPASTVIVTHNLSKYPSVTVMNSADDEVVGDLKYVDLNTVLVSFSAPFGGRITCN